MVNMSKQIENCAIILKVWYIFVLTQNIIESVISVGEVRRKVEMSDKWDYVETKKKTPQKVYQFKQKSKCVPP